MPMFVKVEGKTYSRLEMYLKENQSIESINIKVIYDVEDFWPDFLALGNWASAPITKTT